MRHDYSHRAIWKIAAPMILSAITAPLLGMVDTAVMGHLDRPRYLAAVAAGSTIFSVLFMGLNFLRMGTTGVSAQAYGGANHAALRTVLGQAMLIGLLLAALILLAKPAIGAFALQLLSPGEPVAALTLEYFNVRVWSAPAALANYVLIGWLLGMQNARGPLAIMLVTNLVNIALDLLFVLGLGMTVRGVALATLIAEVVGLLTALGFVSAELGRLQGDWAGVRLSQLRGYRRLLGINLNLFIRTMALMFVFAFITAQGARMGTVILAVNALLMNFQLLLSFALDGIAHAAEALVGKAVGSGDRDGLIIAVRRSLAWSLGFAALFCVAYGLGGSALVDLLTSIDEVRTAARDYLPWLVALPLISVWSFLYDGVYVGATRSRAMMVIMVGSALGLFLPVWYGASAYGNHGLWLAFTIFMAGRGLGMHVWFRRMVSAPNFGMNDERRTESLENP